PGALAPAEPTAEPTTTKLTTFAPADPSANPAAEPTTIEPAAIASAEPVAEPAAEPTTTEPAALAPAEPVAEPTAAQPAAQPTAQPAATALGAIIGAILGLCLLCGVSAFLLYRRRKDVVFRKTISKALAANTGSAIVKIAAGGAPSQPDSAPQPRSPSGAMLRVVAERDALFARMILDSTDFVLLAKYVAAEDMVKRIEAAAAADAVNAAADAELTAAVASRDAFESSLAPAQASVACCSIASPCARTRQAPYAASA
ncbi:hypothetical protein T492DRAFT_880696, partial [Pavlovales sp. CCMP2436]